MIELRASRYLGWLRRHWKDLPVPRVFQMDGLDACGCYFSPGGTLEVEDVAEYEIPAGAIVLGSDPSPSTVAHEWRHHWQRFHAGLPETPGDHRSCPWERDCFLFELAVGIGDSVTEEWEDALRFSRPRRLETIDYFVGGRRGSQWTR